LDLAAYSARFAADPFADLPVLGELAKRGWIDIMPDRLCLTETGMEHSDAVGPRLYSEKVRRLMETYPLC
jgi:oxygen-independent coproporphyrinogen III oxidase